MVIIYELQSSYDIFNKKVNQAVTADLYEL